MIREPIGASAVQILAPSVLCVDDDPHVLVALRRTLSRHFSVDIANGGGQGLELLGKKRYAVVIVDMKMPEMSGTEFLRRARELAPETARILLTGNADFESAVLATNDGGIFRFACKPYNPVEFPNLVADAVHHHHLLMAEKDVAHQTLAGAANLLLQLATLLSPGTTERLARAREVARSVSQASGVVSSSLLETAALVITLVCVTEPRLVPPGARPTAEVRTALLKRSRAVAERLLGALPCFSQLQQLLERAGREAPDAPSAALLSPEVVALLLLLEREALLESGWDEEKAHWHLELGALYPRELLDALRLEAMPKEHEEELSVCDLEPGMVVRSDIVVKGSGQVLLRHGTELTRPVLERIRHYARSVGVVEPIGVVVTHQVRDRTARLIARKVVGSDVIAETDQAASGTWKTK